MGQEAKREPLVRLPNPSAQPFVTALKRARFFAVIFFWVTMVCLLAHLVAFGLTEWVGFFDVKKSAAPEAAEPPAPSAPIQQEADPAITWHLSFESVAVQKGYGVPLLLKSAGEEERLPMEAEAAAGTDSPPVRQGGPGRPEEKQSVRTEKKLAQAERRRAFGADCLMVMRIIGTLGSILLCVTVFVYLQIALLGRLGGIRQLTNAFFILLMFLMTVLPWDQILGGLWVGAFYNFESLFSVHTERLCGAVAGIWPGLWHHFRFFALPAASVVLLAAAYLQFASGYGESVVANE